MFYCILVSEAQLNWLIQHWHVSGTEMKKSSDLTETKYKQSQKYKFSLSTRLVFVY